jgi:integrase
MLSLYRRHKESCPQRGRSDPKCRCAIWVDGELDGKRYRYSLNTRDWQTAITRRANLENPNAPKVKPLTEAITGFENSILSLEFSTQRKIKNILRKFRSYCDRAHINGLDQITTELIDGYRASRKLSPVTASKELQTLKQFFEFCRDREWIVRSPAKPIKPPRNVKSREVRPYTPQEIIRILAACDAIGKTSYERRRARAMVLLLCNTALRISDVATLARDRVRDGRILVRTLKTGELVELPIWDETARALDVLPAPRGAEQEPPYYFWNATTGKRAVVGIAERTLAAVFKKSGVMKAHAHRFRHTLATTLLGNGASFEVIADILGNSPAIVKKHYAKWCPARQDQIDRAMATNSLVETFGANLVQVPASRRKLLILKA